MGPLRPNDIPMVYRLMIIRNSPRIFLTLAAASVVLAGCSGGGKKTTPTVGERVPVLSRIETGAKVDPELANISVVLPGAQTNSDWAQAGGTASKSYGHLALEERSEARRGGKECVSTGRSRWSRDH